MNQTKQTACVGLLAHVDAGKTTLAEAILYRCGRLRSLGRVDHGDTAMDYDPLERERGITIFAAQAHVEWKGWELTLLDTPGHVDFSAETERMLQVLDCAVLVISGTDGVQAHTRTLWNLLGHYQIPTVLFVTKMDLARISRADLLEGLRRELGDGVVDFSPDNADRDEALAMCAETAMEEYLEEGAVTSATLGDMLAAREIFPCFFGSGLKLAGIDEFLDAFTGLLRPRRWPELFGARVFKITHDAQGVRLTHLKVTGGSLQVRDSLSYEGQEEKITQLRRYQGGRFIAVEEVFPGQVCSVVGLTAAWNGQGFGTEAAAGSPVLEPVMHYRIGLPAGTDPRLVLPKLRQLEAEDPMLRLRWDPRLQELSVGLMGEVQAEVLKSMILDRFDLPVELGQGRVLYKETIDRTVEGVGHYEPLRHYAEVHLLLEPLPRGSGLVFATTCSEDKLDRHWQRLILTHLAEKEHLGTAIGAPITDMKLTLAAGKAHLKHTEGGDFRQATYRAVRQGLMQTPSVLLEPWYRFRLEVPTAQIGRAITDIKARFGSFDTPEDLGGMSLLRGRAPVAAMTDYAREVAAYTRGLGKLALEVEGYELCHDPEAVRAAHPYDPEGDLDNTPDSVFCAHGGGFTVKWDKVFTNMHLESVLAPKREAATPSRRRFSISEKELQAILEREFGPIRRPQYSASVWKGTSSEAVRAADTPSSVSASGVATFPPGGRLDGEKPVLIVDGFNVIFAWPDLAVLAQTDLEQARDRLMEILANYASFTRTETILVFDAYQVKGGKGERFDYHGVQVVYTRENETGDAYIERLLHDIGRNAQARVVTSDNLIQVSALRSGVIRQSAREFGEEIDRIYGDIAQYLHTHNRQRMGTIGENLPSTP
ncbi:MAG: NYN domain-containing protein [Oscillospiraceae bacterium]|nr:NYN domain-containing protein [Oscillospiraceae bacterium]